ncbi:MAG: Gfo/Idh/MocA family oxidoreductase [Microgenomates group bacterium]
MQKLKIGFIGCGKHAKANIYPSVLLLGYDITAVCARHLENAQTTADRFHAKSAYDDYRAMLKTEQLDVVFVITSGDQHVDIVIECLKSGAHVFVEKPLGWTTKEAREVAKISEQTKKHVMVGFMKRFAPSYLEMKRIISDTANFGEVLTMTGMFGVRPFGDDEIFLKYGAIHYVDLMRFLFGEIKDLHGFKRVLDKNVSQVFSFATDDGKTGTMFFAGLPAWARHQEEITISGTQGFVKVDNLTKVSHHFYTEPISENPRWQTLDVEDRVFTSIDTSGSGGTERLYINGYVGEVKHFLESIESNGVPNPSAEDNCKTMELVEKILTNLIDPTK